MRYKTKPCEIEAIQFLKNNKEEIKIFTEDNAFNFVPIYDEETKNFHLECSIFTLEGVMTAKEGDYIIRGLRGEYYPCKPDVFYKKYEPIY